MISKDVFDKLSAQTNHGGLSPAQYSSWAVYGHVTPPASEYDATSDLVFPASDPEVLSVLHTNFVMLGLNPGTGVVRDPLWANFHVGGSSKDERVAELCRQTVLWGSFITDLFPLVVDSSGRATAHRLGSCDTGDYNKAANIARLESTLDILGVTGDTRVICFGTTVHDWAHALLVDPETRVCGTTRRYELARVMHYSGSNAHIHNQRVTTGYARQVIGQIRDQFGTEWQASHH